jgi:peptidyl-prolyl cis-trans isomerase A (cyclophilin A)
MVSVCGNFEPDMKQYILFYLLITALCILFSCGQKSNNEVVIKTTAGDIVVRIFPENAPQTAKAFLSYVDSGYYKKSSFYRILSLDNQPMGSSAAELIQGGVYKTGKNRDHIPGITHEPTSLTGLKHERGTISLARVEAGTASTEFFICIADSPGFDEGGNSNPDGLGYAAFGRVVTGMDVVMSIYNRKEHNQEFTPPIVIINILRK